MIVRPHLAATLALAAAVLAAGCSKGGTSTADTSASPAAGGLTTSSEHGATIGDAAHGKEIFSQDCASCHGATGREGGVGPSLKNEKSRKNATAAVAWIENPQPPMPKLYPSPLGVKDVDDVAAYVESL